MLLLVHHTRAALDVVFRVLRVPPLASVWLCALSLSCLTACNSTYNCWGPHCYGTAAWDGQSPSVISLEATVKLVPLNGGDGFVDDEVWVIDRNDTNCTNVTQNIFNLCWIELGAVAGPAWFPNDSATHLFWAENRPTSPGNPSAFFFHTLANPSSGELSSHVDYAITRDARPVSGNGWIIAATTSSNQYVATTTNSMAPPASIEIGQELYGSSGASAPKADFAATAVGTDAGVWDNNEVTTDGNVTSDNPPNGSWQLSPAKGGGGIFITQCCQ